MNTCRTYALSLAGFVCLAMVGACHKPPEEHLEPVDVSRTAGRAERPSLAVGPNGTAYLAWSEANSDTDDQGRPIHTEDIRLAFKPPRGAWSVPTILTAGYPSARYPSIVVDRNDVVHLAWQQRVRSGEFGYWAILYTRQAPEDTWITPDTITMYYRSTVPTLAVDQDAGRVHLYWNEDFSSSSGYTCYACKPAGGVWQDFQSFSFDDTMVPFSCEMRTDKLGSVHIVQEFSGKIYHLERKPDGLWNEKARLSENATGMGAAGPSFAIRNDGGISVVWTDDDTCYRGLAYRERDSAGTWLPIEGPYRRFWKQSFWGTSGAVGLRCVTGPQGRLHIVWHGVGKLGYGLMTENTWSQPKVLAEPVGIGGVTTIAVGPDGTIFYAWGSSQILCVEFKP